jgi:hypothetical protein
VGKFDLLWALRNIIGGIGWKVFILCLGMSQEKYWQMIYEQELARKSEESAATPSNKQSTPCSTCGGTGMSVIWNCCPECGRKL